MELTLTHLDGARGAFELVPNTNADSSVAVFTGRPTKGGDRVFGMTQDLLGGFGVRNDVAGAGRQVAEDVLHIRARMRTYKTNQVVVRHADMLHPGDNTTTLDLLADICMEESADLAVTCDHTVGQKLAEWVEDRGGRICPDTIHLASRMPTCTPPEQVETNSVFPRSVPRTDFYAFRARAKQTLTADQFAAVDERYVRAARAVMEAPFSSAQEAGDRLLAACQGFDNPAEVTTILRAAQAAMFRHGILLKVDVPYFTGLVSDTLHRPLNTGELIALRAYRATWRSAAVALLDSGMSYHQISDTSLSDITDDGGLTSETQPLPAARALLRAHRHFMLLNGATPSSRFIEHDTRRLLEARRDACTDLSIPSDVPQRSWAHTAKDRWRKALGVSLLPLQDRHLALNVAAESYGEKSA